MVCVRTECQQEETFSGVAILEDCRMGDSVHFKGSGVYGFILGPRKATDAETTWSKIKSILSVSVLEKVTEKTSKLAR